MKFFLTGGAGFIGSYLTSALLEQGHTVTSVDNFSTGSKENIAEFLTHKNYVNYTSDLESFSHLEDCIKEADVVYHLAASVGVKNIMENPIYCIENNIICTSQVLKLACKYKKRIFTFSTSEVYGKTSKFPSSEEDDLILGPAHKLRWAYAASKLIDDYMSMAYFDQHGTAVTVVRLFNTIGQRQVGHYGMVVPRFFEAALNRQKIQVYGTGSQTRCFTDVRDVVRALILLIDCKDSYGQLFNIGNDSEITILELARKIKDLTKSSSQIELVDYEIVYGKSFEDMERRLPDHSKIESILNFKFEYSLEETLSWIYQSMKDKKSPHKSPSERSSELPL